MKFKRGDYVGIASDYPFDRMLQHQTGNIVSLPAKEYEDEYTVKLDGGITHNRYLGGRLVRVSARWLELAIQIKPRP